jgi:Trk K+ transport system NAD-binding subunit
VTIAGATVALAAHAITSATMIAIVLMSIVSSLLWPALAQRLMPRPPRQRAGVIVQGGSTWAALAAAHLRERGEEVLWLGDPVEAPAGVRVLREVGQAGVEALLRDANAGAAAALLALSTDTARNAELCRVGQQRFGLTRTVAMAGTEDIERLRAEGIGCFLPESAPLVVLEAMARAPLVLEMLSGGVGGAELQLLRVESPAIEGLAIRDLDLPREVLLIGLERDGQRLLPRGDTHIHRGDSLTALGTPAELERLAGLLRGGWH